MFIFKKLVTPFLLPPGIFVVLALILAVWQFKKNRRQAYIWAAFGALIWLASLKPVGNYFLSKLEYAYLPPSELKADVIIVLGAGMTDNTPEVYGASLNSDALERAAETARLYHVNKLPIIVTGGAVFASSAEAVLTKKYLIGLGVPEKMILTDDKARDTFENAEFSRKICEARGYKTAALLTSAYHMPRSVWTFKNAGFKDIVPCPAAYRSSKNRKYYYVDALPSDLEDMRKAMHEYIGLVFYKMSARPNAY